jgi:hypothetical protein
MAARDKRDETGEPAGDQSGQEPFPLDHHLGHREELTPLRPGDDAELEKESRERD